MRRSRPGLGWTGLRRGVARSMVSAAWVLGLCSANPVRAQFKTVQDPVDARIRRTDPGNIGVLNESSHRMPDLTMIRWGRFMPNVPWQNRFAGAWNTAGDFVRIDLEFVGLMNPPGPLWFDDVNPEYDPFRYGPNPVCGWIEFDLDGNENTGGETSVPRYRYLGNVARFGGVPQEPRFAGRAALNGLAFDGWVPSPPYVERSGEEFHIAFRGESIQSIAIETEATGGNPQIFEAGESWILTGDFFHRAHSFEAFAFQCATNPGGYLPIVQLRFTHSVSADRTLVTLVYPLTNAASAALLGPGVVAEPTDGCAGNQNSIQEALIDLQFSAQFADPWTQQDPRFVLLAGWASTDVGAALNPLQWRTCALVGACYVNQIPGARYAWTDVYPNPHPGDFNGDGCTDPSDAAWQLQYIATHDGQFGFDEDGNSANNSLQIPDFSRGFDVHDLNYDGLVNWMDYVHPGDLNGDSVFDIEDVQEFVNRLLGSGGPPGNTEEELIVIAKLDLNCDGRVDGADIQGFIHYLISPPSKYSSQ
ncbi:MAG: hypothetical protein HRU71_08755 [Planctomycetia bacterium]|nr:MAG: hypothetical protein HRU71_08755 [Planctomycetia bacterium]